MRILLVSQEFPPETGWGGIGTYFWSLGRGLVQNGHEVHVLSVSNKVAPGDRESEGLNVHRRPLFHPKGVGRAFGLMRTYEFLTLSHSVWREFKKLHRRYAFDVVEFSNWKAEPYFFTRHRPVPSSMRLTSMAFQLLPLMNVKPRDLEYALRLEEQATRRVDMAHGPRQHLQMVAERFGLPPDQLKELPTPLEIPADPGPPAPGPKRILFCGRFEPRKNPEVIVRAAPKVLTEFPQTRFVFVGRDSSAAGHDSYLGWLLSLAEELGVRDSIEIVDGWQPDGVRNEMPRASVVAVPSRSESFGYVAAEASSYGRAVLASNVNGLSELVDDGVTGRLLAPEDVDGWSQSMLELLRNDEKTLLLGSSGRRKMERTYSPKVVGEKMTEAYEYAIARHAKSMSR